MLKTICAPRVTYPYEEFADHLRAMKTVREWQYTSRFGHLGRAQTSLANSARIVEYFSDSYEDHKEAVQKAELFLSIYDYLARHAGLFSRKDLMEKVDETLFSADPALLRAVHYAFTVAPLPRTLIPKKLLTIARAFKEIHETL